MTAALQYYPDSDSPPSRRPKGAAVDLSKVDRLPPHSLEAEQGVLGCLLLAPVEGLGICLGRLRAGGEIFYDLRHRTLFGELVAMYDAQQPIDLITVHQQLRDANRLEEVGGLAYLSGLMDAVPSAVNLEYYLGILREKHVLRKMLQTCTAVLGRVQDHEGDVDRLIDEVECDIMKISQERETVANRSVKEIMRGVIDEMERDFGAGAGLKGLGTGFRDFDWLTNGLRDGEMIVVAARPSMGKTSLAMNIVEHVAVEQGLPVGVFSLEMTAEALLRRMVFSRARVSGTALCHGFLTEADQKALTLAGKEIAGAPLHLEDASGLSILQLRARARRMWQQHGVRLIVIDYLQLLHSTARTAQENRQQEIASISNGVKSLAKELRIPVLVLSQLNRDLEKDKCRKPRLSDLRESGAIEQDADVVALLYKPRAEDEEAAEKGASAEVIPVNLLIAKHRNGDTGDVPLTFLRGCTRFESAAKITKEDLR